MNREKVSIPRDMQHICRALLLDAAYRNVAIAHADGPLEGLINSFSVAVTNFQPLNDGKKWLAKVQAGDYAEGEIAAKLDQYIQNNAVSPSASLRR